VANMDSKSGGMNIFKASPLVLGAIKPPIEKIYKLLISFYKLNILKYFTKFTST